jgi:hypothetical protein
VGSGGARRRGVVSGDASGGFGRETTSTFLFLLFYYFLAQVKFILTFFNMDVIPSGGSKISEIVSIYV